MWVYNDVSSDTCLVINSLALHYSKFFLVLFWYRYILLVMESMGFLWIGIKEYAAWWTFWVVSTEWFTSKGYYAISLCQYVTVYLCPHFNFNFFSFSFSFSIQLHILSVMESMGSLWIGTKEYAAWWTFWVVATEWFTSKGYYAISLCRCVYC